MLKALKAFKLPIMWATLLGLLAALFASTYFAIKAYTSGAIIVFAAIVMLMAVQVGAAWALATSIDKEEFDTHQ